MDTPDNGIPQELLEKAECSEGETIMLRSMNDLKAFDILATDGEIRRVISGRRYYPITKGN
jgi:hypothetical protein